MVCYLNWAKIWEIENTNFSNSLNHIRSPVFHVPTNERVIKANSFGMKIASLGMYRLNVICVRGIIEWMPMEVWNKTDGLIKNQCTLRKRWKWLTLKDKNSLPQNLEKISTNCKVNGSILRKQGDSLSVLFLMKQGSPSNAREGRNTHRFLSLAQKHRFHLSRT